MRFPFVVVLLAALGFNTAQAEIYTCTVEGRQKFSQVPCGDEVIEVKPNIWIPTQEEIDRQKSANQSVVNATLQMQYTRELTRLRREIRDTEMSMDELGEWRDDRLKWLSYERRRANNNLAGAVWESNIVSEMDGVRSDYVRRFQQLTEYRAALIRDLNRLENQPPPIQDASNVNP
ncbi:DUF4124 domain-containing protein [Pseudomonas nitroreducens]|uniref:DUF4124 domain-containing protein n=1 Tax=Pseudomonas nitroreducens TaxID=46680 RepID=A0A5R8ZTU0_PSENT|nr:DUF4124 domain-containing protein [Pseudomonas nitroreducens]TLP69720.1 DUF4124 domain-containing protein [Pseudomonas nitroreducens]